MQTQNTQNSRPFMSIRQAARSTGISEYQFRQMHRDGNLPGFHSGTKYNVDVPRLSNLSSHFVFSPISGLPRTRCSILPVSVDKC